MYEGVLNEITNLKGDGGPAGNLWSPNKVLSIENVLLLIELLAKGSYWEPPNNPDYWQGY